MPTGEEVARGNYIQDSRLTLGGTERWPTDYTGNVAYPTLGVAYVDNLGWRTDPSSFDPDDLGGDSSTGASTGFDYTGSNGYIAINEEDTLIIRFTGYVDPNNVSKSVG